MFYGSAPGFLDPGPVPLPLHTYRTTIPAEPPSGATPWRFLTTAPPYTELRPVGALADLARLEVDAADPPRGLILVATSSHGLSLAGQFRELQWTRSALPWCPLVVAGLGPTPTTLLAKCVTRLARRGVVPLMSESASADAVAAAVNGASDVSLDLPQWLASAAPGWPMRFRQRATDEFAIGFRSTPLRGKRMPSRQTLWARVGRAMRAAYLIQMNADQPVSQLAHDAGYSDFRSMDRALLRVFGVYTRQIRPTVGWEWLLWRLLCQRGNGKELRWDQ